MAKIAVSLLKINILKIIAHLIKIKIKTNILLKIIFVAIFPIEQIILKYLNIKLFQICRN